MAVPNDQVTTLLEADTVERRRDAATALVETAAGSPEALVPVIDRVVGALSDPDDRVRTAAARICFEVGTHDPVAVESLLDDLLGALDDPLASVRANVARPAAEVIVRDPAAHRATAAPLRGRLDDQSESVRHSVVWALEWLATRHPTIISPDRVTALLDDEHPPVRKHAARLCALCPHTDGERHERLVGLLSDESIPVREAACLALGAAGRTGDAPGVRSVLGQTTRAELNEGVRLAARRALREATYEATVPTADHAGDASALTATLAMGERARGNWLRVDDPDVTVRGGRFRGTVETIDSLKGTISLRNAPVGYQVELRRDTDGWVGTYEGPERSGTLDLSVATARDLDPGRTPLRYAVEGDRIGFEIEETPHSIEVTDHDPETDRVRGENWMQGYAVEFRPDTAGPVRALFERGRAFEATDITLLAADGSDEA